MSTWSDAIKMTMRTADSSKRAKLEALLTFVEAADRAKIDGYGPIYYENNEIIIHDMNSMYLFVDREVARGMLLGLQNTCPEHVSALTTHDLNSGKINVGETLTAIRLGI